MINKIIDWTYNVYAVIVIVTLLCLFGSVIYFSHDPDFIKHFSCEKSTGYSKIPIIGIDGIPKLVDTKELESYKQCERMERLVDASNYISLVCVVYALYMNRENFVVLYEWIKKRKLKILDYFKLKIGKEK